MLDRTFKTKWIDALRNGPYHQVESMLGDNKDGRCCLGVACELMPNVTGYEVLPEDCPASDSHPDETEHLRELDAPRKYLSYVYKKDEHAETEELMLSPLMMADIGVSSEDAHTLARMNDCGHSFRDIAKWIYTNL